MNKFSIAAVLIVGLGAVYGVYTFRGERLTASSLSEIENAQNRVGAAEQQAAAERQYATDIMNAADDEKRDIEKKRESAQKMLEQLKGDPKKLDPNLTSHAIDVLPPEVEIVPVESMPDTAPDTFMVQFDTTKGAFIIECHKEWAPNGAARLYELVKNKFFTDMRVFRAVEGFVVQFGIPGDPAVSAQWLNKNIDDDPVKQSNNVGMFTFAAGSDRNTRSTQVFVNLKDNMRLDSMGFAPVAKVILGMDVVKSLYNGYGEQPTELQEEIATQGNAFLDKSFPKLDSIKRAVFVSGIKDVNAELQRTRALMDQRLQGLAKSSGNVVSERAPDVFKVKLECTMGDIVVECHREWAPLGADRFYTLVKNGFYNDSKFFRVVPNFVVQFGIPAEPSKFGDWLRAPFADDPVKAKNEEGTITFAAGGKNTRTTQVFFNLKDNSANLDTMGFAPFGKILEGMDVAKKINPEYGELPEQVSIRKGGNEYLNSSFPKLDGIKAATILE